MVLEVPIQMGAALVALVGCVNEVKRTTSIINSVGYANWIDTANIVQ